MQFLFCYHDNEGQGLTLGLHLLAGAEHGKKSQQRRIKDFHSHWLHLGRDRKHAKSQLHPHKHCKLVEQSHFSPV